ncbi:MAG: amino acid permease [Pseudodesulfovibrio sp.]|nr:amino acid permease [Pseudodesulfovibrio sp.]
MSQRKIGTFSLCCMMIGAVLGSGIIILPPLAIESAGQWAVPAWGLTALFGIAFAYVFAHIGTLFPGEGGAASAVESAFGSGAKRLATYTLSGAALFGPAAVMLTIVDYLPPALAPETNLGRGLAAGAIQIASAGLLISGLRNMSRVTLVLASTATALLLVGSGMVLAFHSGPPAPLPEFNSGSMGYTLLLLFWAVVGWEVVGNYGAEVINPRKTVPRAAIIAAIVVGLVSMAVAAGLQYGIFPDKTGHGVAALLYPLFGSFAPWVMAGLVIALCVTTYLMFVGGVARLVAHLAKEGGFPLFFDQRNAHGVPLVVIAIYTMVHLFQIFLASTGVLDVAGILAIADGFFLVNALLGTMAAVKLFAAPLPRMTAILLSLGIFMILMQSRWQVLSAIAILIVLIVYRKRLCPTRAN